MLQSFRRLGLPAICAAWLVSVAQAHQQPTTLINLDVAPSRVTMQLHLPLPELELAFGHNITANPQPLLGHARPAFEAYLLGHLHPVTPQGQPWQSAISAISLNSSQPTPAVPLDEALVTVLLIPPPGATTRHFILNYDAILHQVVTHKALVSLHSDWSTGQTTGAPVNVGIIRVDAGTSRINSLPIHLNEGSSWLGFTGMISLGMHHISEGPDHLMFLLALLLPATLIQAGSRWATFGGSRYTLLRLVKIVTAFTIGHSLTLLAGALGWLNLPQQLIEVLIAVSILVSAIHAIRPLFPGREVFVAAGFGLIHGLAFAAGLAGLNLSLGTLALSILGFNLGIEVMQLFVLILIMPWLILLSLTPFYPPIRVTTASLAAIAALGWIVNRISGQSNPVEQALDSITALAPVGIFLLALLAIAAYFSSQFQLKRKATA